MEYNAVLSISVFVCLFLYRECVAVFIELYKKTVTVPCFGSDFLSDWTLYTAIEPRQVATKLECPVNSDWIVVSYRENLQHILSI